MTQIVKEVQKQDPGSALVTLYKLEYADNTFAYFTDGTEEDTTSVQFRDTDGTIRTYIPIPIMTDGIEISSDGSQNRPEVSVGNIGNALTNAIGGIDPEELIGRRLTRRTTLQKYLVGESGDSTPPVEFPKAVYILDRLKNRNIIMLTFELASPFDVAGVKLPRRTIIAGACPFRYKAASARVGDDQRVGGCNWDQRFIGQNQYLFMNKYDEYIVPSGTTFTSWSGGSATAGNYYQTAQTLTLVGTDATTSSVTRANYWQAITATSDTPSDSSNNWRRVRRYFTYNSGTTYSVYTDARHCDYVLDGENLWQVKGKSIAPTHPARAEGATWTKGDICGKKLSSCRLRFQAQQDGTSGSPLIATTNRYLPFGGFPSAKQRR